MFTYHPHHHHCHHLNRCFCGYCYDCGKHIGAYPYSRPYVQPYWPPNTFPYQRPYWYSSGMIANQSSPNIQQTVQTDMGYDGSSKHTHSH